MHIKLRDELCGEYIHTRVFMGPDKDRLSLTGTLVMRIGEWQLFGAALLRGAKQTQDHLTVSLLDNSGIRSYWWKPKAEEQLDGH